MINIPGDNDDLNLPDESNDLLVDNDELDLVDEEDELDLVDEEDELDLANENAGIPATETAATLVKEWREDENQLPMVNPMPKTWKVMIVDDEVEIHDVTQLALDGFVFRDKSLTFISAYSAKEAKSLLNIHPDIALIFLDVVMEEADAGLQLAKYIRETLKNQIVRIILRTGQPGEAPEEDVIVDYDINDYKLKVELTHRKLFVTIVAGLRAYYDLMTIEVNKATLKQTLEAVPVGVGMLNTQGKPLYLNQKARQILGKGLASEATTENLADVYQFYVAGSSEHYLSEDLPVIRALHGKSTSVDDIEIHQGEKTIPIETWGTPICDSEGNITYAITALQDISERKQAEKNKIRLAQECEAKNVALRMNKEIEEKNKELVQLNQDKNEFLGIAAHDLKNPLSAIKGYTEDIQETFDEMPKKEMLELIGMVQGCSHQMFDLVTNLLDVNAIEAGKVNTSVETVDIFPIMEELVKAYMKRAQAKKITLLFQSPKIQCHAFVDKNIVHQVLDNLISNAVKYSPFDKSIFIRIVKDSSVVRCEIQDEGPGLSAEDQQKLFGKFTRLSSKPTGDEHSTGLGLFIVRKLIEAINGSVWCESELGKGATFITTFKVK
ncbi:ATP-binding protein [Candidatus Parabeggiatoa sp. HSG14]|uniref:sensor histidine kinase n=1 Tax=Candidatus Parabeggiatoa sp. HSG14 TaxID=3055593 RepID=UPI0025A8A3D7|nr:ATP-binding protein [Thiotrichales bacterium HSG14]